VRPATASAQRSGPDAREAAREYIARGWAVIDVPLRAKAPTRRDWQHAQLTADDVDPGGNIGLVLGEPSAGLVDVDVDCTEALAAAPYLLPETGMCHGRPSKPSSHHWYVLTDPKARTVRYRDPDGSTLVELRGSGGQTIVPPSVHPSGELLVWEADSDPARLEARTLRRGVAMVAAAAMVARRWPAGSRHDGALALAGLLCRGRMAQHDAERLIEAVSRAAGDDEWRDRVRAVRDTYGESGATTGATRLADLLPDGQAVVVRLREWLDLGSETGPDRPNIRVVTVAELLALDLPPREMVLSPWLPAQGLAMLYGPRGTGKTWLMLAIAYAVASGAELLTWRAPRPRRVLYIDGEMPASVMRERLARLIRAMDIEAPPDHLRIITPDVQPGPMPDLSSPLGRAAVEPYLADLVIVDSISSLTSSEESEADAWLPLQRWCLDLRRAGRSVLLGHHAGKGGQQRGTSRREDVLDTVLALRRPADYHAEDGARAELVIDKGRGIHGDDARTIEIALTEDGGGGLRWTYRTQDEALTERVAVMVRDKLTHRQIASELHCGVSTVSRHRRAAITAGLLTEDQ